MRFVVFVTLECSWVRLHRDYHSPAGSAYFEGDTEHLECLQRLAMCVVPGFRGISYGQLL